MNNNKTQIDLNQLFEQVAAQTNMSTEKLGEVISREINTFCQSKGIENMSLTDEQMRQILNGFAAKRYATINTHLLKRMEQERLSVEDMEESLSNRPNDHFDVSVYIDRFYHLMKNGKYTVYTGRTNWNYIKDHSNNIFDSVTENENLYLNLIDYLSNVKFIFKWQNVQNDVIYKEQIELMKERIEQIKKYDIIHSSKKVMTGRVNREVMEVLERFNIKISDSTKDQIYNRIYNVVKP